MLVKVRTPCRRCPAVLNQLDGFNRFIATLSDYGRPAGVTFEAMGNYRRAQSYRLGIASFEVKIVTSVALARAHACGTDRRQSPLPDALSIFRNFALCRKRLHFIACLLGWRTG